MFMMGRQLGTSSIPTRGRQFITYIMSYGNGGSIRLFTTIHAMFGMQFRRGLHITIASRVGAQYFRLLAGLNYIMRFAIVSGSVNHILIAGQRQLFTIFAIGCGGPPIRGYYASIGMRAIFIEASPIGHFERSIRRFGLFTRVL